MTDIDEEGLIYKIDGFDVLCHKDGLVEISASKKGLLQISDGNWKQMMNERASYMVS